MCRRKHAALADHLRQILAFDVLPDHVMRAVREGGEVVQRRHVRMLNLGCQLRLAQETLMRIGGLGDLRADHFDDACGFEEDVFDFVDLAHPSHPKSLDDLVLAVNGLIRVPAQEIGYGLATMRASLEGSVKLGVTLDTVKGHFRTNHTAWRW
jgi:hypothetical protein